MNSTCARSWVRRAQPGLGTLVEVGALAESADARGGVDAAFAALHEAQACLSRFDADSDIARFNALPSGAQIAVRPITQQVLAAAVALRDQTSCAFDISLGSGAEGWVLHGAALRKLSCGVRLDLGGIGKGHAVDLAVQALIAHGVRAGWVNAGGDLRAFGDFDAPVALRDERAGGVRPFATLRDGAFATSCFGHASRSRLTTAARAHVSVAAPLCLWADALTKVVALSGDTSHPLLARHGAIAWLH